MEDIFKTWVAWSRGRQLHVQLAARGVGGQLEQSQKRPFVLRTPRSQAGWERGQGTATLTSGSAGCPLGFSALIVFGFRQWDVMVHYGSKTDLAHGVHSLYTRAL